jgi:hypothetical protein
MKGRIEERKGVPRITSWFKFSTNKNDAFQLTKMMQLFFNLVSGFHTHLLTNDANKD